MTDAHVDAKEAKLFVAVDSGGFVGAFLTKEKLADATKGHPVVMLTYPVVSGCSTDHVYVLPSHEGYLPAFVSNSHERITKIQHVLNTVSLTIDDDVKYWKQPVGVVCAPARRRWDLPKAVASLADEQKLFQAFAEECNRDALIAGAIEYDPPELINENTATAHETAQLPAATTHETAQLPAATTHETAQLPADLMFWFNNDPRLALPAFQIQLPPVESLFKDLKSSMEVADTTESPQSAASATEKISATTVTAASISEKPASG